MNDLGQLREDGERFIPGELGANELEHLHRYLLATRWVAGKRVLDIASGEGYGSDLLARTAEHVIGVDVSDDAVAHALASYRRENLSFLAGSCAAIPLQEKSIDVVVSFETIEHHDEHEKMFEEIDRVLRPGGLLVMSSPNKLEYSDIPGFSNPFHVHELYLHEFDALLRRHFKQVRLLGQRVVQASVLAQLSESASGFEHAFLNSNQGFSHGLSRPVYFLALASNGELPSVPDSVLELPVPEGQRNAAVVPNPARFQIYWRASEESYTETRSQSFSYSVGTGIDEHLICLAADSRVENIRIDVADRPLLWQLGSWEVCDAAGAVVWSWDGAESLIGAAVDCFVVAEQRQLVAGEARSLKLACTSADPNFELALPPEAFAALSGGTLRIRFSAREFESPAQADLFKIDRSVSGFQARCEQWVEAMQTELQHQRGAFEAAKLSLEHALTAAQAVEQKSAVRADEAGRQVETLQTQLANCTSALAQLRSERAAMERRPIWRLLNRVFHFV